VQKLWNFSINYKKGDFFMENQYPVGKLHIPENIRKEDIEFWISEIEVAPEKLLEVVKGLSQEQLETPYREGGWSLKQVVHHLADSHMNAYIRMKLGLTEVQPTIKPYNEVAWAELEDNKLPIDVSIDLFSAVHKRLVYLLKSLNAEELKRSVNHPEGGILTIEKLIATYAWHGNHHIAHIQNLRNNKGW
jgi:uncharacterized damage-inducible protein DinB